MNELVTLEASLRELLEKLDSRTCPLILGGGYGLYLRRHVLQRQGTRTLLDHWPEARSTNDLDLFLRPELMCDSSRLETLKSAFDELGYQPVKGAEHYQFRKEDPSGFIERGIKIDLLTGPSSRFDGQNLKIDERRVRPLSSVGIHAHPTDEAITLEENLQRVVLETESPNGDSQTRTIFLPHPFTYLLMKLFAFRDQVDDRDKGNGGHHALDLYSIVAMMSEIDWHQSNHMANVNRATATLHEASRIVQQMFNSLTSRGLLVMRANPYCSNDLQLNEFIELLTELF